MIPFRASSSANRRTRPGGAGAAGTAGSYRREPLVTLVATLAVVTEESVVGGLKPRSREVTDGYERAGARAMLRAVGMTDDDWDKPQVGGGVVLERGHALQHAAGPAGQAVQGGRARRRRLPAGVHHHRRERRHLHGPRGHAGLAGQPGGHRRLGRAHDARRALRRPGDLRRLRQVPARHADGRGPAQPAGGVPLRRLDHAGPAQRPGHRHRRRVRGRRAPSPREPSTTRS